MKTCPVCNQSMAEWLQDHGTENCVYSLKKHNEALIDAAKAAIYSLETGSKIDLVPMLKTAIELAIP